MEEITILDDQSGPIRLSPNTKYKLINPDGENIGGFFISGTPLVNGEFDGQVHLVNVPHTGQVLFVDVNHDGGSLIRIANYGAEAIYTFVVRRHPDISGDKEDFGPYRSMIVKPKPFTVIWSYYDPAGEKDVEVSITLRPIPNEHALEVSFTTSE